VKTIRLLLILGVFIVMYHPFAMGAPAVPVKESDKCPVCGMFVAKYKDFLAQIVFSDGSYRVFDGAKDMFKYFLNLHTYDPKKEISDISGAFVTDYYSLSLIDAQKAVYVIGSDVYGPMGHELIPFVQQSDALEFMQDHKGKKVLSFDEVTPQVIQGLD